MLLLVQQAPGRAQAFAEKTTAKETGRPYKILTSGKQITVKSIKSIKSVMAWTASGNRLHEQRAVNNTSYSFRVEVNEKMVFVMIQMTDGKVFTEKVGL